MTAPIPAGNPPVFIVTGPTCSGKSALALRLAKQRRGRVINADSMQIYAELRVLTARPTAADEACAPHALYGVRPAREPGNAAWWREAALIEIEAASRAGEAPILCGGTGLYLQALIEGLAPIPEAGDGARMEARDELAKVGPHALHARLAREDPETAARLRPGDSQRIARAWEVLRGTGRGLADWQRQRSSPAPYAFHAIVLDPPREVLRDAIGARAAGMVEAGALGEVQALLAQNLPGELPVMRAHGVREFAAFLAGEISLEEAIRRTALVTGQYAKRQATWLRHQLTGVPRIDPPV